jgi:hypothetical protein
LIKGVRILNISDVIQNNKDEKSLKRADAICSTHNLVPPKKDISDSEREKAFGKVSKALDPDLIEEKGIKK